MVNAIFDPELLYASASPSFNPAPTAVFNQMAAVATPSDYSTPADYINQGTSYGGVTVPHEYWFQLYGPMQIGVLVGQFLYGAFAICAFLYLKSCKSDWWVNRLLIAVLLVTAGVETLFGCTQVIEFTAVHTTDLEYLVHMSNKAVVWIRPVVYSVSALLCQVYMTFRILLIARNVRKTHAKKGRFLMALGGMLCILVIGAWGTTFGAVIDMTLSNETPDDLVAFTDGPGRIYRILGSCSVALVLLVDVLITAILTSQIQVNKKAGFLRAVADGIVGMTIRNNLIVTLCQIAQVILTFVIASWGAVIPLFVGKVYALTVLCIIAQPAYASLQPATSEKSCDLCKMHSHAIAAGVTRCPACGSPLRRDTEMSVIPLSPKEKESTFTRLPREQSGIPSLSIRVNTPMEEKSSFHDDTVGPKGERQV